MLGDVEYVCGIGPNAIEYNLPLELASSLLRNPSVFDDGRYASQYVPAESATGDAAGCVFQPVTGANVAVEAFNCPGPPFGPLES